MKSQTTAEEIAIRFDDGRSWEDVNGVDLFEAMRLDMVAFEYDRITESRRYTFDDDSAIVIRNEQWEIGRPGCFCPAHVMHQTGCIAVAS